MIESERQTKESYEYEIKMQALRALVLLDAHQVSCEITEKELEEIMRLECPLLAFTTDKKYYESLYDGLSGRPAVNGMTEIKSLLEKIQQSIRTNN